MREQVYTWLGEYLSSREKNSKARKLVPDDIRQLLEYANATLFLLICPIMEQKIFGGYMINRCIARTAKQFASSYKDLDIDDMFRYFHQRYQDKDARRHLQHGDTNDIFNKILKKTADQATDQEKIAFLFYVVYRYRNNIFHGNKGIRSWSQYTEPIAYCLDFMMKIIDCQIEMKETAK